MIRVRLAAALALLLGAGCRGPDYYELSLEGSYGETQAPQAAYTNLDQAWGTVGVTFGWDRSR